MWIVVFVLVLCALTVFIISKNKQNNVVSGNINKNYNFNIVGEAAYQNNLKTIAGPKKESSKFHQCTAKVTSEPTNKFDKNAVKVEINGLLVGYLSKSDAQGCAGRNINKSIPAVIDGGWDDGDSVGQYGVKLAINNVRELI